MATPDPDSVSLLGKVLGAGAAIVAPIWGARTWLDRRFDKKSDKKEVSEAFAKVDEELTIHRGYFKDVFNQMRENEQRAQDRHERLMERLTK